MLTIGIVGAEAPTALLARLCRLGSPFTVCILVNRFQPWRTTVVRGERHPLAEVRLEQRPGHLGRGRIKQDGRSGAVIPLGGRCIFRIQSGAFALAPGNVAIPLPIPHGGIVGHDLGLLIIRVAWLTGGRHKHLDPILDVHNDRIGLPVGLLALIDNLEDLPEPIDGRADQLVGRHAHLHPALTVRQFRQVRHRVRVGRTDLQRIVETSVTPHARHIVVRHVAVIEELARQMLTATAAAFRFEVQGF